jgi:hypothetical protein
LREQRTQGPLFQVGNELRFPGKPRGEVQDLVPISPDFQGECSAIFFSTALHRKKSGSCDQQPLLRISEGASWIYVPALFPPALYERSRQLLPDRVLSHDRSASPSKQPQLLIPEYFNHKPLRINILPVSRPIPPRQVIKNEYLRRTAQKKVGPCCQPFPYQSLLLRPTPAPCPFQATFLDRFITI